MPTRKAEAEWKGNLAEGEGEVLYEEIERQILADTQLELDISAAAHAEKRV